MQKTKTEKKKGNTYVGTHLAASIHDGLKSYAEKEGRSMSKQLQRIVEAWLKDQNLNN